MKVYLVEDTGHSPGRVYAVIADVEDAERFAEEVANHLGTTCEAIERELYYGQPPKRDVCP